MSNPNENLMQDDLRYIMSTSKGRRFVWGLFRLCGKGSCGLAVGLPDATAFNLGKLDVVSAIEAMMDLNDFVLMLKEAKEQEDDDREPSDRDTYDTSAS